MTLPLYVVDAFTSEPFRGNPAAVVPLDEAADPAWMQRVAAEMRHSETAFVRPAADGATDGEFELRWFTPAVEVDLCGHATLATAHVLWETGRLAAYRDATFRTRGGTLSAARTDAGIRLDFPLTEAVAETPVPALFDALGLPAAGEQFRAGDFYVLVEAANARTVRDLAPDPAALREIDTVRAVIVTARGDDGYDCVSRVFGPRVGIDEDPVTGSAHCVLAGYWCPRLGSDELRAYQASPRGGEMIVRRAGDRAQLLGQATTVVRGELLA
jgi:PhzF family phenazine biosynthesis protein